MKTVRLQHLGLELADLHCIIWHQSGQYLPLPYPENFDWTEAGSVQYQQARLRFFSAFQQLSKSTKLCIFGLYNDRLPEAKQRKSFDTGFLLLSQLLKFEYAELTINLPPEHVSKLKSASPPLYDKLRQLNQL